MSLYQGDLNTAGQTFTRFIPDFLLEQLYTAGHAFTRFISCFYFRVPISPLPPPPPPPYEPFSPHQVTAHLHPQFEHFHSMQRSECQPGLGVVLHEIHFASPFLSPISSPHPPFPFSTCSFITAGTVNHCPEIAKLSKLFAQNASPPHPPPPFFFPGPQTKAPQFFQTFPNSLTPRAKPASVQASPHPSFPVSFWSVPTPGAGRGTIQTGLDFTVQLITGVAHSLYIYVRKGTQSLTTCEILIPFRTASSAPSASHYLMSMLL